MGNAAVTFGGFRRMEAAVQSYKSRGPRAVRARELACFSDGAKEEYGYWGAT